MTTVPTVGAPARAGRGAARDLHLVLRQLYYEQLGFWMNPIGAVFSIGFSVVFLVMLAAAGGETQLPGLGGIRQIQYYVPGFVAYGVMSVCFNNLAIVLVISREARLLKRLRLTPLPAWVMFAAIVLNSLIISALEVIILLTIGKLAFHVELPAHPLPFVLAILVGVACFSALGVATSSVVPNQQAAGPVISIAFFVLLFLSGLWYPLKAGSTMAEFSGWFPVRHLITAVFAPFDTRPGASPYAWRDVAVMAIWGVVGAFVAVRRFRWEPRRG